MRPVVRGVIAHWQVHAEDHVDLLAFRLANDALDAMDENDLRMKGL